VEEAHEQSPAEPRRIDPIVEETLLAARGARTGRERLRRDQGGAGDRRAHRNRGTPNPPPRVLIDRMLASSAPARGTLEDVLRPLGTDLLGRAALVEDEVLRGAA
jgi:hypothetical protein